MNSNFVVDLRLYGIMPLIGLVYLFVKPKIDKVWIPLLITFIFGIIISLHQNDFLSFRRSFQAIMMIWFCSFLIHQLNEVQFIKLAQNCYYFIAGFHILQIFYGNISNEFGILSNVELLQNKEVINFLGFQPNFVVEGLLNNANYTGITLAFVGIYLYLKKKTSLLCFMVVLLTLSLTAIMSIITFFSLLFISRKITKYYYNISFILIVILLSYPLLIYVFEKSELETLKYFLNYYSGYRYIEHLTFIELFKDNFFGVGFDKSHLFYKEYSYMGSSLLDNQVIEPMHEKTGPHNTLIKILVELGFLSYSSFCLFIILMQKKLKYCSISLLNLLPTLIFSFLWIDGHTYFFSYFVFAIILREIYLKEI